jgi:hypothetical protein
MKLFPCGSNKSHHVSFDVASLGRSDAYPRMHGDVKMQKRMTISINSAVYDGLVSTVGRGKISQFLEDLARPHVIPDSLSEQYAAMAADAEREAEALAWSDGLIGDPTDVAR